MSDDLSMLDLEKCRWHAVTLRTEAAPNAQTSASDTQTSAPDTQTSAPDTQSSAPDAEAEENSAPRDGDSKEPVTGNNLLIMA